MPSTHPVSTPITPAAIFTLRTGREERCARTRRVEQRPAGARGGAQFALSSRLLEREARVAQADGRRAPLDGAVQHHAGAVGERVA